jgi:hypothetical protein
MISANVGMSSTEDRRDAESRRKITLVPQEMFLKYNEMFLRNVLRSVLPTIISM